MRQESALMDEEMSFPNPVMRTDLPVKRRHWKRYVAAVLVLGLLSVVFLPQILHNRIGRRLLRAKLEAKYNAEISIQDIETSWRGGTTLTQFWIKGTDGRVIGCSTLKSDVSLWKLLRGKYELGKCDVDGLVVDWVFDSGDDAHRDTYERLTGALPWKPGMPPTALARLTGDVTITNGQINFYRGETDPRTLNAVYQTVRFTGVNGKFEIPSGLDKPWKYQLDGNVGLSGEERNQTFDTGGTVCLGENGALTPQGIMVDATAKAANVPSEIVGVLLPLVTSKDYKAAFGPSFDRVDLALSGGNGVLTLDVKELASPLAQIHLKPVFDLKTFPTTVTVSEGSENVITTSLPNGPVRRGLATVNPFVLQASSGKVVLKIKALDVPMVRQWWTGTGRAQVEFQDLKLPDTRELLLNSYPRSLAGQVGLVSGDATATPTVQSPAMDFSIDNGTITLSPVTMQVGAATVGLKGASTVEGDLKMTLSIASPAMVAEVSDVPKGGVVMPLTGTVDKPNVQIEQATASLPPPAATKFKAWVDKELATLRARDEEAAQKEKERQVQEMLKTYQEKDKR
jgi:hypothetical protein